MITLAYDKTTDQCVSVIIVPGKAVTEPGYIKVLTDSVESGAKHEFQALAQMAYYQFQDAELRVSVMQGSCKILHRNETEELACGLVIYRCDSGAFEVAAHEGVNPKKLLEAANRYCTRWVRLDI